MKFPLNRVQLKLGVLAMFNIVAWVIVFLALALIHASRAEELDPYPSGYSVIYPTHPGLPFVPDYMAPRLRVQRLGTQIQVQETYPGTDVPNYVEGRGYVIQNYPGVDNGLWNIK